MDQRMMPGDHGVPSQIQIDPQVWEKMKQRVQGELGRAPTVQEMEIAILVGAMMNETARRLLEEQRKLPPEDQARIRAYLERCLEDGTEVSDQIEGVPTAAKILREARKLEKN